MTEPEPTPTPAPSLSRRRLLGLLATGGVGLVGAGAASVVLSDFALAKRSDHPTLSAGRDGTSSSTGTAGPAAQTATASSGATSSPAGDETQWSHREPRVVVLGDSITYYSGAAIESALAGKSEVSLVGRIGYTIEQVQPDAALLALTEPDIVVINLGTNDAFKDVATADSIANLDAMLALFPKSSRVLVNINTHFGDAPCMARAQAIDDYIDSLGLVTVDWNTAVADELAAGTPITTDTIHPTPAGQTILAKLITTALNL